MRRRRRDAAYLADMLDSARAVAEMTRGVTRADFESSRVLRRAVEREIEIIGEAARCVSEHFKQAHPLIPWKRIISQRNLLAHEYGHVDSSQIWTVATRRVPELAVLIAPLVPPLPAASGDLPAQPHSAPPPRPRRKHKD